MEIRKTPPAYAGSRKAAITHNYDLLPLSYGAHKQKTGGTWHESRVPLIFLPTLERNRLSFYSGCGVQYTVGRYLKYPARPASGSPRARWRVYTKTFSVTSTRFSIRSRPCLSGVFSQKFAFAGKISSRTKALFYDYSGETPQGCHGFSAPLFCFFLSLIVFCTRCSFP